MLAVVYACCVQGAAYDGVTYTGEVFYTTAAYQHDGVLLQVMALSRDISDHLDLIGQVAKKANLAQNEKWQVSARQAFLLRAATVASAVPAGADPAQTVAAGFATADWGKEYLPVQLRFAESRG